ncbi:MAG: hypothetical protein ABSD38_03075 [Syntrophorhabdales bacterium]|jgi:hypothetical protein
MRSSNNRIKNVGSMIGRILVVLALVLAIGAMWATPPASAGEHSGHHGHWRHHGYWRPYGYYYHYPYRPYGYYYYPSPVYGPPIAYAPYPPPGVSFVFPIRIR